MKAQLQRITREIPHRGVADLIIRRCPAEELGLLLAREVRTLAEQGCARCWLQVSTANPAAYQLYLETGFSTQQTRSRWFRAEMAGKKDRDAEEDGI